MKHRMLLAAAIASVVTSVNAHTICTVVSDPGIGKILMETGALFYPHDSSIDLQDRHQLDGI